MRNNLWRVAVAWFAAMLLVFGAELLRGVGAPSRPCPVLGATYFDTTNAVVYKCVGVWELRPKR